MMPQHFPARLACIGTTRPARVTLSLLLMLLPTTLMRPLANARQHATAPELVETVYNKRHACP